jgi:D-serine deaminase-like pyridoxal phosphate-dependent protein
MSYTYTELPAPLVVVGLDIAERNIARSAAWLTAQGIMPANSRTIE